MFDEQREAERIGRDYNPNKAVFLKALTEIPELEEVPDTKEEFEAWAKNNPEKAKRLEDTIQRVSEEFSLTITPSDKNPSK